MWQAWRGKHDVAFSWKNDHAWAVGSGQSAELPEW